MSLFKKLVGGFGGKRAKFETNIIEDDDVFEEELSEEEEPEEDVGELSVDMYRMKDAIIIKAMIAGIQKSDIDISLSRDQITITGARYDTLDDEPGETHFQELYWGKFERSIDLPEEVDIELAEAHEAHGLLTLVLPLIDKQRKAKLKVQ